MDQATLEKLAFFDVIDLVAGQAQSPLGVDRVRSLRPAFEVETVRAEHELAVEAMRALDEGRPVSFNGAADLRGALTHAARPGTHLPAEELWAIAVTIRVAHQVRRLLSDARRELPALFAIADPISAPGPLAAAIESAIAPPAELLDDASSELKKIRRSRIDLERKIRDELERIVRNLGAQGHLQDSLHTLREGRFVVPVRAASRRQVRGIVHDRSASGETYFIEPARLVELGNRLRDLDAREREEILRILRLLTDRVRSEVAALLDDLERIARLDEIFARGRFGRTHACIRPAVESALGPLRIVAGRHPILERSLGREQVVPLDLELAGDSGVLMVTGPNAGGKTVALKTAGLLSLLAQSGIPVPAGEGTALPVWRHIGSDIGDGQSLEANLSTFSAHVANLARICAEAGPGSLVLLDELGTGTDPDEGAALGASVVEHLAGAGARVLATTHLGQLKLLAANDAGVENAAMEFSERELAPTYRLRQGIPGHSYGIEIARRLGLPATVIEDAEQRRGRAEVDLAAITCELEARLRDAEEREAEAERLLARARRTFAEAQSALEQAESREADLRGDLAAKVDALAREARRELERSVQDVREAGADREAIKRGRAAIEELRNRHSGKTGPRRGNAPRPAAAAAARTTRRPLQVGDQVRAPELGFQGTIESLKGDRARIRKGTISLEVDLRGLEPADAPTRGKGGWQRAEQEDASCLPERRLDLRGQRAEDAAEALDRFLDASILAGFETLEIVHGKGTGALRRCIGELLTADPRVAGSRLGGWNEGGAGVTIATLRRGGGRKG